MPEFVSKMLNSSKGRKLSWQGLLESKLGQFITQNLSSLRIQIVIVVGIITITSALCFGIVITFYTNAQLHKQHQLSVNKEIAGYSQIASRLLQEYDYMGIQDLVELIGQSKDISAVVIKNKLDQEIGRYLESDVLPNLPPSNFDLVTEDETPTDVGELIVWLEFQEVSTSLKSLSRPLLTFSLSFLLLITIFVYRYLAFSIVKPLKMVEEGIENFTQKHPLTNLKTIPREIRSLQTGYLKMMEKVRQQMYDLEMLAKRHQRFYEDSPALLLLIDKQGGVLQASHVFLAFLDTDIASIKSQPFTDFITEDYQHRWDFILAQQKTGQSVSDVTLEIRTQSGQIRRVLFSSVFEDSSSFYLAFMKDITVEHQTQLRLKRMASLDVLTGLPNRIATEDVIYDKIRKNRNENGKFGVLFIDLDNFKRINDVYGHTAGDQVLIDFSSTLSRELPRGCLLGRFGGDEFVMVTDTADQIQELINIIYDLLQSPLNIKGRQFYLATSIGIATWPRDGETTELLLRNADLALYQAKRAGRNQAMAYVPQFESEANKWLMTGDVFRQALLDKSFTYYWQPVVNNQKEIVFYELLLRLETDNGETILPGDFLSIAEESGLMGNIAEFTLEFALKALQHPNLSTVKLSLNLSRSQLLLSNLERLMEPLVTYSDRVIIEVTEDAFLGGVDTLVALKRLKTLGFTIALDDFGTGYSSLSLLSDLPVDIVKLDKKFQHEGSTESNARAMFEAIINMLHALGKTVVAEGIETEALHKQAINAGCDYYQGYFFGYPAPASLAIEDSTGASTSPDANPNLITLEQPKNKSKSNGLSTSEPTIKKPSANA